MIPMEECLKLCSLFKRLLRKESSYSILHERACLCKIFTCHKQQKEAGFVRKTGLFIIIAELYNINRYRLRYLYPSRGCGGIRDPQCTLE